MPNINKIDCRTEKSIEAHIFAPSIFSKSSTAGNIAVFKNLNVNQMGIEKIDVR